MFAFDAPRKARRPSLTPMIDVVFLLLVFFMLAARFGQEAGLEIALAGGAGDYRGPPRLVEVAPGALRLNGVPRTQAALVAELQRLTQAPGDLVVIRPEGGAGLQRLVEVMAALRAAGFTGLALAEAAR